MLKSAPLALTVLAASLLVAGSASAYRVRTTVGGLPVHWESDTITLVADASLARLGPGAVDAATRALAAWSATPGCGAPGVVITEGPVDEVGYRDGDANKNTLRYIPDGYGPAVGALAITVLTFDGSGKIVDADIVINGGGSRGFAVMTDDAAKGEDGVALGGAYDLEDVLTHEAGHLFGLAHNNADSDSTMYFATARGETKKRDLTLDDEDGFRSLYPETRDVGAGAACAMRPGTGSPGPSAAATLLLAAALGAGARRRRSRTDR